MNLFFYNSLTKSKELFSPHTDKVKMYVCGPTVYDTPHIGNARSIVIYDILFRLLKHVYGKENVIYVRNITDVDDKINNAAKEQNITINTLTDKFTKIFHDITEKLFCLSPTIEPKATEHINEMITMIENLISNGNAYIANKHVYFKVESFKNYGDLSGRNLEDMISGVRIDLSDSKHHPADFVLWKPASQNDDISSIWDSPWGKGRPGWHIECSAMSNKYLGEDFDIHGGGADLIFPHHTNEIAQSCAANKNSKFAKYWIHNGFLTVNGDKMSKSLGNFITVDDLLNKNIKGEVIRYLLLSTHYRKPLDFNDKLISDSKKSLDSFYRAISDFDPSNKKISEEFIEALADDLNTVKAFTILHTIAKEINKTPDISLKRDLASILKNSLEFVGLMTSSLDEWFKGDINDAEINALISKRNQAKKEKNWTLADSIRNELLSRNIIIEDKSDGTSIWRIDK
ncbi:MAG: cysteine--tRNA ligase [Alphaproteobacteria bacterium]